MIHWMLITLKPEHCPLRFSLSTNPLEATNATSQHKKTYLCPVHLYPAILFCSYVHSTQRPFLM